MAFLKNVLKPVHNSLEISFNNTSIVLMEFVFTLETNKSSGRKNRQTICSASVNSGRTLVDLFFWVDKSSSKNLHRRTNRRSNSDGSFV